MAYDGRVKMIRCTREREKQVIVLEWATGRVDCYRSSKMITRSTFEPITISNEKRGLTL